MLPHHITAGCEETRAPTTRRATCRQRILSWGLGIWCHYANDKHLNGIRQPRLRLSVGSSMLGRLNMLSQFLRGPRQRTYLVDEAYFEAHAPPPRNI